MLHDDDEATDDDDTQNDPGAAVLHGIEDVSLRAAVREELGWKSIVGAAVVAGAAAAYALIFHPAYQRPRWMPRTRRRSLHSGGAPVSRMPAREAPPSAAAQLATRAQWATAVSTVRLFATSPADHNDDDTWLAFAHGLRPRDARAGHHRLPRVFYESAAFGVPAGGRRTDADFAERYERLRSELSQLRDPRPPAAILPWRATLAPDDDVVDGFFVRYDLAALEEARAADDALGLNATTSLGRTAAQVRAARELRRRSEGLGALPAWLDARDAVERVARALGRDFLLAWTPHRFGPLSADDDDDLRHVHVRQDIHPTRAGLQHLRLSTVVWAVDPNASAVRPDALLGVVSSSSSLMVE